MFQQILTMHAELVSQPAIFRVHGFDFYFNSHGSTLAKSGPKDDPFLNFFKGLRIDPE